VVSKFELSERQYKETVRDKIAYKVHLQRENDSFKHIFGILIKFPIQQPVKILQNLVQSERKAVSKFQMPKNSLKGESGTKLPIKLTW